MIGAACAEIQTMRIDLEDLQALVTVARAKGFGERRSPEEGPGTT